MPDISAERRVAGLRAILRGNLAVGLARDKAITEENDAAYERQPAGLTDAAWDGDDATSGNADTVTFPAYAQDADAVLRYWFLADGDDLVFVEELDRPVLPVKGEELFFAPGKLIVKL
ncbi:MAG: hypothetical protein Q8Q14_02630 [Gemmatimonadales bacterium]|nr:hypothetical protein [Gemmatimonadales bacterium]